MKLQPIPRSKAKTAYGLISDVIRAILAEPKRADMEVFADHVDPDDGGPACGTVGCFAGWVCLLRGARMGRRINETAARKILGPDLSYSTAGVGGGFNVFNSGFPDVTTPPMTAEHAAQVVKRIRRFQQVNAEKLKARKLTPKRHGGRV
jgi:hypothetical protein